MTRLLVALVVSGLVACSTTEGTRPLDEMSELELERYSRRAASHVTAIAMAAVREGDLDSETLDKLIASLRALASGSPTSLSVATADAGGYGGYASIALVVTMTELEERLESAGAFSDGMLLGPEGAQVVTAIADDLEQLRGTMDD